jgi:hypothetical protein
MEKTVNSYLKILDDLNDKADDIIIHTSFSNNVYVLTKLLDESKIVLNNINSLPQDFTSLEIMYKEKDKIHELQNKILLMHDKYSFIIKLLNRKLRKLQR